MTTRPTLAWVGADGALGARLAPALGAKAVRLRCPDLGDERPLGELADVDVTINAAGPRVHPGLTWDDYMREHVGCAARVARSVRPGSHLVLVSSAAVYGSKRPHATASSKPQPGSFPVPAYAWAKWAAEDTTRALCRERGVSLTIVRPSIIYGPDAGGILITLRNFARKGLRVELRPGGGRQHLLHVDLFQRVLEGLAAAPPPDGSIFVLADPFVLSSRDLNDAWTAAGPHSLRLPLPVPFLARMVHAWQEREIAQAPVRATAIAMLDLDNVYDWETCLSQLAIDPEPFGRDRFDAFMRA